MTVGTARVGCSGWVYRDWRGAVYPTDLPQRRWFEAYAQAFDTVEVNNTFYRLPDPSAVEGWHDQAPPGFRYALKVGQFGSHRKKHKDPETWLPAHVERMAALGAFQGPNLLQLPPKWHRDIGRLAALLDAAPRSTRWAVEVRDPTWLHDDTYAVLADHGAALCIHDLLEDVPWERTTDWTYVRFHGPDSVTHPYRPTPPPPPAPAAPSAADPPAAPATASAAPRRPKQARPTTGTVVRSPAHPGRGTGAHDVDPADQLGKNEAVSYRPDSPSHDLTVPGYGPGMHPPANLASSGALGGYGSQQDVVTPPAVVRGWLYDPTEHWWALLVGAPPAHS